MTHITVNYVDTDQVFVVGVWIVREIKMDTEKKNVETVQQTKDQTKDEVLLFFVCTFYLLHFVFWLSLSLAIVFIFPHWQ